MNNNSQQPGHSETASRRLGIQILLLAAALLLICLIYRLSIGNRYTAWIPTFHGEDENRNMQIRFDGEGLFEMDNRENHDGYISLRIRPRKQGNTYLELENPQGDYITTSPFQIGPMMTVYNRSTGGFTGDTAVIMAVTAFCLGVGILMFRFFRRSKGQAFYSYMTIYTAGFSLFALTAGCTMLLLSVRHLTSPWKFTMLNMYSCIRSAGYQFVLLTAPFLLIFAAAMAFSNVELLRHERKRFQNVLGLIISFLIVSGAVFIFYLNTKNLSGSEMEIRLYETVTGVITMVFVYFECMLLGAVICGFLAARHIPSPDKDYVIILGCAFRKDGSLTPLLQGRVDRAVAFMEQQREKTGKHLVFVPSGGQGGNETMPEAEAMTRYLISRGIPEEDILPENRSRNTYENMAFSRKLIEERNPEAKVIYSTTNYHVFRSGVWASLAGLPAEGIGSRTKWWFWPNAFVRECIGLLQNRWRQELLLLIVMTLFYGMLSMLLEL